MVRDIQTDKQADRQTDRQSDMVFIFLCMRLLASPFGLAISFIPSFIEKFTLV
jgi:hypothetical protein